MILKSKDGTSVVLHCDCHCGAAIHIEKIEDFNYVNISLLASQFYTKQEKPLDIIIRRIKAAWFMLRGKEYYLTDVIIKKEELDELKEVINAIEL